MLQFKKSALEFFILYIVPCGEPTSDVSQNMLHACIFFLFIFSDDKLENMLEITQIYLSIIWY